MSEKREVIDLSTEEPELDSMELSVHTSDIEFIASEATPSEGIFSSEPDEEESQIQRIYTILLEIQEEVRFLRENLSK